MSITKTYTVEDVIIAECTLVPLICKHCGSDEVTYHQYIGDGYCASCGEWQIEDETAGVETGEDTGLVGCSLITSESGKIRNMGKILRVVDGVATIYKRSNPKGYRYHQQSVAKVQGWLKEGVIWKREPVSKRFHRAEVNLLDSTGVET